MPNLQIHFVHRHVFLQGAAGAIENDIEPTKARNRRIHRALHTVILRHIGLDENRITAHCAHLALGGLARLTIQLDDRDLRTFGYKGFGSRFGDACTSAGQKGHLVLQTVHVYALL